MPVTSLNKIHVAGISCGSLHTLARTSEGHVYQWGRYSFKKQVDEPEVHYGTYYEPVRVADLEAKFIQQVSAGGGHSLAIDHLGHVYSWGENEYGQLGHGHCQFDIHPRRVEAL